MPNAEQWIRELRLRRHPEGGWFREVYRAAGTIARRSLPADFDGDRSYGTAIYFLLEGSDFSALHRLRQDEIWHFYDGTRLTIHMIDEEGTYSSARLGRRLADEERPMVTVTGGCWFGATAEAGSYGLAGCTVAPGFDFADLEMPGRQELLDRFPHHRVIVERLTR